MMTDEMTKQSIDLRDSILRLCNEADSNGIKVSAILMAYIEIAISAKMSPKKAAEVAIIAISVMAGE